MKRPKNISKSKLCFNKYPKILYLTLSPSNDSIPSLLHLTFIMHKKNILTSNIKVNRSKIFDELITPGKLLENTRQCIWWIDKLKLPMKMMIFSKLTSNLLYKFVEMYPRLHGIISSSESSCFKYQPSIWVKPIYIFSNPK